MTYIAYCRKSRISETDELDRQEQLVKEYCRNKGYKLHKLFSEVGSSVDPDRPQYKLMLEYLAEHEGVTILVSDYDRIGRDTLLLSLFKQLCKEHRHLVELVNGTVYSYDNYTDIFTQEILSSVSAYIYQQTKAKMQRGMKQFIQRGGKVGVVPIGFVRADKYHYVLDLEKADIIKQIFTDIASGMSTKEVVNKLEQINFRSNNNKPLGTREIRNIVKNKVYYKNIPQIVSKEQYLEANQQLRSIPNCGNKRSYSLSGKIFCKHCGNNMIIGIKKDRGYPIVSKGMNKTCDCMSHRYDYIEAIVKSDIMAYIECKLAELYQKLREDKELLSAHNAELKAVRVAMSDNKEMLSKLNNLYLMDNISQEQLTEQSAEIKDRISLLELKQQRLEGYSLFKISQEIQSKIIKLEELKADADINDLVTQLVDHIQYFRDTTGLSVETVFKE